MADHGLYDKKFQQKKQLLIQRDELLEQIGKTLFDQGALPDDFRMLPQEFHSMNILLEQLRDRYRTLLEERDLARQRDQELRDSLLKIDREYAKKRQGPRRDLDEITLKVQYHQDQRRRGRKSDDELTQLREQALELERSLKVLGQRQASTERDVREELDPLQVRLRKLDRGIRNILDEEEQLNNNRRKRLQDLAFYHYRRKLMAAEYDAYYRQLDQLRTSLADNTRDLPPPEEMEIVEKRRGNDWKWVTVAILISLIVGYQFRTRYNEQIGAVSALAAHWLTDDRVFGLFADIDRLTPRRIERLIPYFSELPGGEEAFRGLQREDLQQFFVIRDDREQIEICGLKFRRPPARFGARLTRAGWRYYTNEANWLALTDAEERWLWISFDPREFVLLPLDQFNQLENMDLNLPSPALATTYDLNAFDANSPLLQGYDHVRATLNQDRLEFVLSSSKGLSDFALRQEMVALGDRETISPIRFEEQRLIIADALEALSPESYAPKDLREAIVRAGAAQRDRFQAAAMPPEPERVEEMLTAIDPSAVTEDALRLFAGPSTSRQRLIAFRVVEGGLRVVSRFKIGNDFSDMHYIPDQKALLVVDGGAPSLLKLRDVGGSLRFERGVRLDGRDAREFPLMRPGLAALTPDGTLAVTAEREPLERGETRLLLFRTEDLKGVQVEILPPKVAGVAAMTWSRDGQTLYVGCEDRPRRGGRALAVLVYRRQGEELRLSRLIDLPISSAQFSRIHGLLAGDPLRELYLHQHPQHRLVRYSLDGGVAPYMQSMPFPQSVGPSNLRNTSLLFNRDRRLVVVFEAAKRADASYLHLVDPQAESLTPIDTLDFGFAPRGGVRKPLTDTFWAAGPEKRVIATFSIVDQRLQLGQVQEFVDLEPEILVTDQWGFYLYVSGKDRP